MRAELSWTHYRLLLKVKEEKARLWYMDEAVNSGWSTRQLERQINSIYRQKKNCGGNWIGRGICLKNP